MRIGEINQDNYKQMLSLLGLKDNNMLDQVLGKNGKGLAIKADPRTEIEEGMLSDANDQSWKKIIPVSDEVREKTIETVRRQFLENGNGMTKGNGIDSEAFTAINKEYRKNLPPAQRAAAMWTLNAIQIGEAQRLVDYVKSKDPTWKQGQPFDKSILTDSNFGTVSKDGVDVKA